MALAALIKGADWLLIAAERMGLSLGLSPFIVGVTIVGIGTSLPELVSGLFAVFDGVAEIAPANAIGSNIANIFLVVGILALVSRRITVKKNLIDLDLPLLAVVTALFWFITADGVVNVAEAGFLVFAYLIYLGYTIAERKFVDEEAIVEAIAEDVLKRKKWWLPWRLGRAPKKPQISKSDWVHLAVGVVAMALGANYVIESVVELSGLLNIEAGVIALIAIAFGTSLPEVVVSLKAARAGKAEVALGNIIGSCVFNLLMVVGITGLFGQILLDSQTLLLGLPFMLGATFLFIISGISRRIHVWEGSMYLIVYVFFIGKIFGAL